MLRYQPAIGPGLRTQITRYLSQPVVPDLHGLRPAHPARARSTTRSRRSWPRSATRSRRGERGRARDDRARPDDPAGRPAARCRSPAPLFGAVTSAGPAARARRAVGGLPAAAPLRPRRGHQAAHRRGGLHAAPVDGGGRRGLGGEHEDGGGRVNGREASSGRDRCAADAVPTAIDFMRRLRAGLDSGLELPEALTRGAAALPRDARETLEPDRSTGSTATTPRTSGASTRASPSSSSRSSPSSTRRWWRVQGGGRRARAGARPRAARRQPRRASCPGTRR